MRWVEPSKYSGYHFYRECPLFKTFVRSSVSPNPAKYSTRAPLPITSKHILQSSRRCLHPPHSVLGSTHILLINQCKRSSGICFSVQYSSTASAILSRYSLPLPRMGGTPVLSIIFDISFSSPPTTVAVADLKDRGFMVPASASPGIGLTE